MTTNKGEPEAKSQLDKFKEAARQLECDDDEADFKDRVAKLTKPRPREKN